VVEGVERTVGRDRELETISNPIVLDGHGESVLAGMPEQQDLDAVAFAGGKFPGWGASRGS